jgi:hypothetical protein
MILHLSELSKMQYFASAHFQYKESVKNLL